jgi:hypothetical protein
MIYNVLSDWERLGINIQPTTNCQDMSEKMSLTSAYGHYLSDLPNVFKSHKFEEGAPISLPWVFALKVKRWSACMLGGFCIPCIEEQHQKINLVYKTQGKSEALASALEILGHWWWPVVVPCGIICVWIVEKQVL